MDALQEIRRALKQREISQRRLAMGAGVDVATVCLIASHKTKSPRYETVLKLQKSLREYRRESGRAA